MVLVSCKIPTTGGATVEMQRLEQVVVDRAEVPERLGVARGPGEHGAE